MNSPVSRRSDGIAALIESEQLAVEAETQIETMSSLSFKDNSTNSSSPKHVRDGNGYIIRPGFKHIASERPNKSTKKKIKSFFRWVGTLLIL